MEGAKLSRRQRKIVVTRYLGDLSILIAENDNEAVSKKLDRIKGTFREFQKAHITYHDMLLADPTISDEDINASEKWFAEAESKYVSGVSSANKWLNCMRDGNVWVVEDNKSDQATGLMDIMQMPKVNIDVFSGDPMDYHSFIAMLMKMLTLKRLMHKWSLRDCCNIHLGELNRQFRIALSLVASKVTNKRAIS